MQFPEAPWYLLTLQRAIYMESTDLGLPLALAFIYHVIWGKSLNFSEFQSCQPPHDLTNIMNIEFFFFTITLFFPETQTEHLQDPDFLLEFKKERHRTCSQESSREHKQTVKIECCGTTVGMGVWISWGHKRLHKTEAVSDDSWRREKAVGMMVWSVRGIWKDAANQELSTLGKCPITHRGQSPRDYVGREKTW